MGIVDYLKKRREDTKIGSAERAREKDEEKEIYTQEYAKEKKVAIGQRARARARKDARGGGGAMGFVKSAYGFVEKHPLNTNAIADGLSNAGSFSLGGSEPRREPRRRSSGGKSGAVHVYIHGSGAPKKSKARKRSNSESSDAAWERSLGL